MRSGQRRDHGGNLDAAMTQFGGSRRDWIDLSTGINPTPFPIPEIPPHAWSALPDRKAMDRLIIAARRFWNVPDDAGVLAVPGASSAIARIPALVPRGRVLIPGPTYNEHAAAFAAHGWTVQETGEDVEAQVIVHPNNPDGRLWDGGQLTGQLRIIDESFCDVMPDASLISEALSSGTLVLKSFGKFWGLAGVRLGFVIGDRRLLSKLAEMLGPWSVPGPAIHIGTAALLDLEWAENSRARLARDADHLDQMLVAAGARAVGGTALFRLYDVPDAAEWQMRLAENHIWSRVFPYNPHWLRLGLPGETGWQALGKALP